MREEVARRLNGLDAAFYREQARSFSDTRRVGWPGWERCLAAAGEEPPSARVLDVAAGNLRFARFLAGAWPHARVSYDAVDACPDLMRSSESPEAWRVGLHERDIVGDLLAGAGGVAQACPPAVRGSYDLVVCFGFAHHVPTAAARGRLVRGLLDLTAPGGVCCVSLWRFMEEPTLARKARLATARGLSELGLSADDLDEGDWLLGWQDVPHAFRYCHSFSNAEVDALARQDGATLRGRFLSDGRTGALNAYLVWERSPA